MQRTRTLRVLVDGTLSVPCSPAAASDMHALARSLRAEAVEVAVIGPLAMAHALRSRIGDVAIGRVGRQAPEGIVVVPVGNAADRINPEAWWVRDDDDAWQRRIARWARWRWCIRRLAVATSWRALADA